MRRYSSFLIRHWRLDGEEHRIEVEHIQSGEHALTTSLDAMLSWMEAHEGESVATAAGADLADGRSTQGSMAWEAGAAFK